MSWSYVPAELETSLLYQVRLRIGDTDVNDPLLQDEEIAFFLTTSSNDVLRTSLLAIKSLIAKSSSEITSYTLGPYSESTTNKINNWRDVQQDLLTQVVGYASPVSKHPTTSPVFNYDMMSDVCCEVFDDEP